MEELNKMRGSFYSSWQGACSTARAQEKCNYLAGRGVVISVMNKSGRRPSNLRLNFMSAKSRPLQTRFRKETRFDVCPIVTAPFRGHIETQLEVLKHALLQPVLRSAHNPELRSKLTWAAQEAASLAWLTPFPLLILPTLFEEKISAARQHWLKQQKIRRAQLPIA
jgi:hypothetical protein